MAVLAAAVLAGAVAGSLVAQLGPWPVVLLVIGFVFLVVAAGFGGFRRMTRPVGSLVEAAGRIEAGDYSAQVAETGAPDMRSVARAFNAMSARLEHRVATM